MIGERIKGDGCSLESCLCFRLSLRHDPAIPYGIKLEDHIYEFWKLSEDLETE